MNRIKITIVLSLLGFLLACGCGKSAVRIPKHLSAGAKQMQKGLAWYKKGCYDRALEHFLRAHELYSASDTVDGVAMSLNNVGSVYQGMGDYGRAVVYFDEAYTIYSYLGKEHDIARALSHKAAALTAMGKLDEAEEALNKALDIESKDRNRKACITILNNKGVLLTKKKQYKEAETLLMQCLREVERDDFSQSASVNFALGNLMIATERFEEGVSFFDSALEYDRRTGFYRGMADDLFYMGLALSKTGKEAEAIERWKRSVKIYALIGCAGDAQNVLGYLTESSLRHHVDLSVTASFVKRWLLGESYESPCHN